jgi:hypothetical protein
MELLDDTVDISDEAKPPVVNTTQAIQAYKLMEARAKAEQAELEKRSIMQRFRPSNLYPSILHYDGLRWVCEYISGMGLGPEEENGGIPFVAYGAFPEEAMQNFDVLWVGGEANSGDDEKGDSEDEGI